MISNLFRMAGGEPVRGSGLITVAMRSDQTKKGIRPEEEPEKNPVVAALRSLQTADDAELQEKWRLEEERRRSLQQPADKRRIL